MEKNFDFYRIKTRWVSENAVGDLSRVKTEELVYASSYTEAEKVAHRIAEDERRAELGGFGLEIVKTRIGELVYRDILKHDGSLVEGLVCNRFQEGADTGTGLYCVSVMFIGSDEKTGKERRTSENIYVPATSNVDATQYVGEYLKKAGEARDFVVKGTRLDGAWAVLWPAEVHREKARMTA